MRVVCKEFPLALFLNTLGVAEYRLGNYQAAVEACLQSVELSPQQLGVAEFHARDLAFLAMSYHQLGKAREAETYRRQFLEAMKKDAFRDDEECLGFARELVKLFDGKGETESK
ncbi:MAG: tetratricopeptide repeat protein [Planctomycetota bacterium]